MEASELQSIEVFHINRNCIECLKHIQVADSIKSSSLLTNNHYSGISFCSSSAEFDGTDLTEKKNRQAELSVHIGPLPNTFTGYVFVQGVHDR